MTRYSHYIRPCSNGSWPQRIVCLDCTGKWWKETQDGTVQVEKRERWYSIGLSAKDGVYQAVTRQCGTSSNVVWRTIADLLRHEGTLWVISYRCSRIWSLLGMWEGLEDGRLSITGHDFRSPRLPKRVMHDLRHGRLDSLAGIPPAAMRKMHASRVGYLVLSDPPNIARIRVAGSTHWVQWVDARNYGLERPEGVSDGMETCEWLAEFIRRFRLAAATYHLGGLQATASSQAMHAWKRHFYTGGVYAHCIDHAAETEDRSNYGGRCECCKLGRSERTLWHLDIRSMYTSLYSNATLPVRLRDWSTSGNPPDCTSGPCKSGIIARVAVETEEPAYPYRRAVTPDGCPIAGPGGTVKARVPVDMDTIFPIGRFVTTLCGPELDDALDHGRIHHWVSWCRYDCEPILSEYGSTMLQLLNHARASGHHSLLQLAKRLSNCIVGKWGQRDWRWSTVPGMESPVLYGRYIGLDMDGRPAEYRVISGVVQREEYHGYSYDAVPSISAWICSLGRVKLLELIRCAEWQNVYYYDTDSLLVTHEGYERLCGAGYVMAEQVGSLQVRDPPAVYEFRGIKYYVGPRGTTCAGMPGGDQQDIGDGTHYYFYRGAGRQSVSGKRPEAERVVQSYARKVNYRHGNVQPDGRVTPIELCEF